MEGSGQGEDVVSEVELGSVDPERDSHRYMAVLVEALSILGKVQEALDVSALCRGGVKGWSHGCNFYRPFSNAWKKSFC